MFHFNEPVSQIGCQFALIKRSLIKNSPYQRDLSTTLVRDLAASITGGFIIPVLLVPTDGGLYELIDGQHRLNGADKNCNGDYDVPAVIVPERFKERFLLFNIEKGDNIRDQATKVYNFYMDRVRATPYSNETKDATAFNYMSYIISISFAYREFNLDSPSLIESPCKKLDNKSFILEPYCDAIEIRRHRAQIIRDLELTVQEVCNDYNISDFNLKKAIVSKSSTALWERKRNVPETFDEGMEKLINKIKTSDWSWMAA